MCRGAKIIFWQFVRVSKKGFRKKMCTFCFCLFYGRERKRENMKKHGKIKFQKKPRKIVFFGCLWRKLVFFVKTSFFREIGKHYLCSEGQKKCAFSLQLSVFGKRYFFGAHSKSPNTTKIGVSAGTGENPKWHFWLQKCHFGFSLEKGFYYLWYLKAVFCWKHYFYSVFSKTQLCRHERMYLDKKQKFYKNRGWFARMQKGVFFRHFFGFGGFVFYSLCFCAFVLFKIAQNGYFPAFLEVFCLFCSHKRPVLKCFFSSYFVFFAFVFLFKNPFLYFLFVHQPLFYKRLFVGFLFFFFCLSFPFLRFACLFDTNFPNIPFLKSNLLSFLAVSFFFCCSCFFVFIVYVSAFLLFSCYVGFVFGVFVLFCFVFLFLFFFLVLLSVSEKKVVFPANLVFFWVMLVKRVVWSLCFMFLFLFVFLVLFLSTLKNSFVLFCFCVVVFFLSQD